MINSTKDLETIFYIFPQTLSNAGLLSYAWSPLILFLAPYHYSQWYISADPLLSALTIALFVAITCYLVSEVTGNNSQVDRMWSILPMVYAWHFALRPLYTAERCDPRVLMMTGCATLWGCRLTYNFYRKGGYKRGEEDYRWAIVRSWWPTPIFKLFNLFFIAIYQNILILWFSLPIYGAWMIRERPTGPWDFIILCLWMILFVGEATADRQQWDFQSRKKELIKSGHHIRAGPYADGFISTGLWQYSRHPNFFFEISMWWTYWAFTFAATGEFNWIIGGPALLSMLFLGSTTLTEKVTSSKYPHYAEYQKHVSMLIPLPGGDFPKKTH